MITLRRVSGWLAGLITLCLVGASCGFGAQTLQPYAPADGVNLNAGTVQQVEIRNLLIISAERGEGIVSATIFTEQADQLVEVSGTADGLDGNGTPLTGTLTAPITVRPQSFVKLTALPPIVVRSDALEAGHTAQLTLRFRNAGRATIRVPVLDADISYYKSIEPLAPCE